MPSDPAETPPDAVVWAICPHIRRWSDSNWNEYASEHQQCDRCPESETIDGYDTVCPWRCDAELAARAALEALANMKLAAARQAAVQESGRSNEKTT
jgi:hypothetical protein